MAGIEQLAHRKAAGNRWERRVNTARNAAVDLPVPAFTSRPRSTGKISDIVTAEAPYRGW